MNNGSALLISLIRNTLIFLSIIIVIVIFWTNDAIPLMRSSYFVSTSCLIKESFITKTSYTQHPTKTLNALVTFQAKGKEYTELAYNLNDQLVRQTINMYELTDKFHEGANTICWYDPLYPRLVILTKPAGSEIAAPWAMSFMPIIIFIFIYLKVKKRILKKGLRPNDNRG